VILTNEKKWGCKSSMLRKSVKALISTGRFHWKFFPAHEGICFAECAFGTVVNGGCTLKLKRILAPTDLSELYQDGVRVALEMATARQCPDGNRAPIYY
jgi:hypothetical protein